MKVEILGKIIGKADYYDVPDNLYEFYGDFIPFKEYEKDIPAGDLTVNYMDGTFEYYEEGEIVKKINIIQAFTPSILGG